MRLFGADHVDGGAGGLRQLGHLLRRHQAGVVGPVGEYDDGLAFRSSERRVLRRSASRTVVERGVVSCDGGTRGAQDLRAVRSQQGGAGKVAAVRIERHFVRALERANEIRDGILRKHKASVHVVAGVEQNKNVGACYQ